MELTKNNIVNWINKRVVSYRVSWDDIVDYLDMAIDEINSYMSTKYPHVSSVLNEYAPTEKTYSYRAGGMDVEFFPGKYFTSIVMPYAITQILTTDEEFTMIYSKYMSQYQESLFIMARDEMNNIPYQFISAPKGVYFANPDPQFKQNPEKYFNQQIVMDIPKIRVFYSWGNYKSMLPFNVQTFVEKPLPRDPNAYETGFKYMPIMMAGENYSTYIVDYSQKVLGVFLGWSLKDDNKAEGIIQSPIDLYEDATFYAVFDLDIVGIEYNGNGGTVHNWRPTYLTKSEFNANSLTPMGGTAFRKGYRFVGFELEKTNEFTLEEEYDGFEEENDVVAEPGATFKALWYKMIYNISYIGAKGNFKTTKINYTFGQEFDLDLPVQSESEPDEFIGWWDNPQFLGDRVTKINESDYGDKTFYAKYNEEKYRIRWLNEDDTIIKEDFLTRGAFLTEPENMTKDKAWIDGLLYRFDYVGFVDEYNYRFQPGITKARRNTNLKVVFSQPIKVETELVVYYKVKEEGIVQTKEIFIKKQVGTEVDVDLDILQYLSNDNLNTYEDLLSVQQFVKSVSFINSEEELVSGMTFIMDKEEPYQVSCNYDTTSWTVTFRKKTYSDGVYSLGASVGTHKFADNTTKAVIENKGASYLDILYEVTLNTNEKEYLQGFKALGENDIETDMPTNIESDLTLVPYYGPTVNTAFVKTLTLVDMPMMDSLNQKQTITQHYRVGTEVSLLDIKQMTETNQYKYMKIDKFFSNLLNGVPSNEITSNTLTLNNNRNVYIQTASKKLYSVIYKNYSSPSNTYNLKEIDYYPFHFESGNISFNTQANQPVTTTSYLGSRYVHKGWSTTDDGVSNELTVTLLQNRGENLILYPIFVRLGDIIINYNFMEKNSNPLLTDYSMQSTRMTSNKMKIVHEDYKNVIGSNKELFANYTIFLKDLNTFSSLFGGNAEQPQQVGYNFYGYKINGGELTQGTNIIIPIPNQGSLEAQDVEINLTILLERDPSYVHLLIGDSSKPNGSLNSSDIDLYTEAEAYQRNKFITKGLTFNKLISDGEIPALRPYEGQPLYYCYSNPSQPLSIIDVTYTANVVGDMEIFIKDTVEGLHQFRIIYQELSGPGRFTTLKTMFIYPNQISQYGNPWVFDINLYKPNNPQKYGYIFKGYSSPSSNGAVATTYPIGKENTQDIYFTAVYNPFGYINVNFKVKGATGDLITDYDLTGDLSGSNPNKFAYTKQYTFSQRTIHYYDPNTILNEFKNAIEYYNERAQMGYDVVRFEVRYPAGVIGTGESSNSTAPFIWSNTWTTLYVGPDIGIADLSAPYNTISGSHIFATQAEAAAFNPTASGQKALVTGFKWVSSSVGEYNAAGYKITRSGFFDGHVIESDANRLLIPSYELWDYGQSSVVLRIDDSGLGHSYWKLTEVDETFTGYPKVYESIAPSSSSYVDLTNVLDSAIDGKDCNITFTFILRRKSGYVHVEVLENSVPDGEISHYGGRYGKFFIAWGESIATVRADFDANYDSNPIDILQDYDYYTYNTNNQYTLLSNSYEASPSTQQNIKIFIRDDI